MRTPVVMPDIGPASPIVSVWFVAPADRVYAGDRLVEILIGGATIDVTAPVSGRMVEIMVWPDAAVTPGQVLGYIEENA